MLWHRLSKILQIASSNTEEPWINTKFGGIVIHNGCNQRADMRDIRLWYTINGTARYQGCWNAINVVCSQDPIQMRSIDFGLEELLMPCTCLNRLEDGQQAVNKVAV